MMIATLSNILFIVHLTHMCYAQYIKKERKMFPRDLDQEVLVHSPFRYSQLSEFTAQVQGRIKAKKLL